MAKGKRYTCSVRERRKEEKTLRTHTRIRIVDHRSSFCDESSTMSLSCDFFITFFVLFLSFYRRSLYHQVDSSSRLAASSVLFAWNVSTLAARVEKKAKRKKIASREQEWAQKTKTLEERERVSNTHTGSRSARHDVVREYETRNARRKCCFDVGTTVKIRAEERSV